jgi:hypothetical protein
MNVTRRISRFIMIAGLCVAGWSARAADDAVASAMTGHWKGDARIIVSWCRQTNLHVAIEIETDGTVTGKIGDATIKGRFDRNRGWLGRRLNLATDYIIRGELDGPIVAAEGITRGSVSIPLNFIGGELAGGVHTSGSKFGGKKRMILSASSLTLKQPE